MKCRSGENVKRWFRSNRIFNVGTDWFFTTREGINVGPCLNRDEADKELMHFLRYMQGGGDFAIKYLENLQEKCKY